VSTRVRANSESVAAAGLAVFDDEGLGELGVGEADGAGLADGGDV
jgi:hypothetical protein